MSSTTTVYGLVNSCGSKICSGQIRLNTGFHTKQDEYLREFNEPINCKCSFFKKIIQIDPYVVITIYKILFQSKVYCNKVLRDRKLVLHSGDLEKAQSPFRIAVSWTPFSNCAKTLIFQCVKEYLSIVHKKLCLRISRKC